MARFAALVAIVLFAPPVRAWDAVGHQAVARIAWERMSPEARREAVGLLLEAPAESGLPELLPIDSRPLGVRQRELFVRAAVWADLVRDEAFAERKERYDHPRWHYTNIFWEAPEEPGALARPRDDLRPAPVNLVERLEALTRELREPGASRSERALDLAWIVHLVADLHQPLHTSARVTPSEPEGDRGGNLFHLEAKRADNLHAYWDRTLSRERPRRRWESEGRYIRRLSEVLVTIYPPEAFAGTLSPVDYEGWARQSYRAAVQTAYPADLLRGRKPPRSYRETVHREAEASLALAGYRLAALLEELLGREEGKAEREP